MPRKATTDTYVDEIYISQENYDKILMWSMSEKEINFICFGKDKTIENVYRLSNIARNAKNFCFENENERKTLIKLKKRAGQKLLASGHSHPKNEHSRFPSEMDVKYIKKNTVEIIVFPCECSMNAWKISSSLIKTKKNPINIQLLQSSRPY